jgi:hypothetical protein
MAPRILPASRRIHRLSIVRAGLDRPDMPLVPLLRDLASVGLTLANDQAGRTWLRRSAGVAHG